MLNNLFLYPDNNQPTDDPGLAGIGDEEEEEEEKKEEEKDEILEDEEEEIE